MDERRLAEMFADAADAAARDAPPAAFDHSDVLAGSERARRRQQRRVAGAVAVGVVALAAVGLAGAAVLGPSGQQTTLAEPAPSSAGAPAAAPNSDAGAGSGLGTAPGARRDSAAPDSAAPDSAAPDSAAPDSAPDAASGRSPEVVPFGAVPAPAPAPPGGALQQAPPGTLQQAPPGALQQAPPGAAAGPPAESAQTPAPPATPAQPLDAARKHAATSSCATPDTTLFAQLSEALPAVRGAAPRPLPDLVECPEGGRGVEVDVTDGDRRGLLRALRTPPGTTAPAATARAEVGGSAASSAVSTPDGGSVSLTVTSVGPGPAPYADRLSQLAAALAAR